MTVQWSSQLDSRAQRRLEEAMKQKDAMTVQWSSQLDSRAQRTHKTTPPHHSRTLRLTTLRSFAVQAECQRTAIIAGFTSLPLHCTPHVEFSEKLVGFSIWNGIFTLFLTETASIDMNGPVVNGVPFNDAYRYMNWSLTVPLPLIEILLVMKLDGAEFNSKSWSLGSSAAMTIVACYHGESVVTGDLSPRWICWFVSMIFSCYIVYELLVGPATATAQEADPEIRSKIQIAQVVTVISWCTYPVVYLFPVSASVVRRTNCNWLHSALSDVRSEGECLSIANLNFSSLIVSSVQASTAELSSCLLSTSSTLSS